MAGNPRWRSRPGWSRCGTPRTLRILLVVFTGFIGPAASLATAQPVSGTFDGFKVSADAPIVIDSNTLVVSRKTSTATFSGRVVAVRGTMRMTAKSLVVTYRSVKRKNGKKRTEITRLDAKGGVKVINRNQSADGDWAVMNVPAGKITIGGNVVLRQDKTVIRGNRLNINLRTGRSHLIGGNRGGRVHGVFIPAKKK